MDYRPYVQMMGPNFCKSPIMQYPVESMEDMYPEVYHVVYPKIKHMCVVMDVPGNSHMYPYPSKQIVERMTDDIYKSTMEEMGYPEEEMDFEEYGSRQFPPYGGFGGHGAFGRRRFLRDLISILLIRQLLRRRGHHNY